MSLQQPLVSVIIPNHNRERALALCVDSVRSQTYPRIEIIVVDDHSTDGSLRVAGELGVTVLRTAANGGPSIARNLGAARARGEILFFLDSDVALEPDGIASAVAELLTDPRLGAICGQLQPEPLLRQRRLQEYRALQLHCWFYTSTGRTVGFGLHTALFGIRRTVFEEAGPLNPRLRHNEGPEYGYRLGRRSYEVRTSRTIRGRKDSDATLQVMLPKVFRRSQAHAMERDPGVPFAGLPARVVASGLCLAAVATLPLPLLVGGAGLLVPPALLGMALLLDADTLRFVVARRGTRFGLYFAGVHVLLLVTSATGGAIGVLRRMVARPSGRTSGPRRDAAAPPGPRTA
ncbi:glycosyltransferase family 2 protein [Micromonospora sp. NPDC049171]|uniref:glycosyltransferase family 2 protein n=1 Tax=Micromonospora sp. NPDC049171 TaxID=3155770 RepID=UPI0033D48241